MESSTRVQLLTLRNWIFLIGSGALSAWFGVRYGFLLENSDAALSGIVSVFSILAGVLVAVISIIGDPSMLLTGNWRVGHVHAEQTQIRLARYAHLVFVYFLVLVLVLMVTVIKDNKIQGLDVLYKALMSFSVFGLIASLPLPYGLMSIQKERMKEEIKRRKLPLVDNGK